MSYSTHVYLHGYCSSLIIILLISSLSYVWLSSQLSLSHFIIALSFSHLNSAKLINFSFFFKISGFEDEDDDSSAEILHTIDWVRLASLGGEWVGNADQPLRSNNLFGNGDGDGELIEHGGRVGQSCYDCDCVVVVIVVVEDRWISGQILVKGSWLGVGVDREDKVVSLCQRGEGRK